MFWNTIEWTFSKKLMDKLYTNQTWNSKSYYFECCSFLAPIISETVRARSKQWKHTGRKFNKKSKLKITSKSKLFAPVTLPPHKCIYNTARAQTNLLVYPRQEIFFQKNSIKKNIANKSDIKYKSYHLGCQFLLTCLGPFNFRNRKS